MFNTGGSAKYATQNKAEGSNSFFKGEAVKNYLLLILNIFSYQKMKEISFFLFSFVHLLTIIYVTVSLSDICGEMRYEHKYMASWTKMDVI